MSFSLNLLFLEQPKDYKIPGSPIAYIQLKNFSCFSFGKGNSKKDFKTISNRCYSFREFEFEVDRLKNELDSIKKKAKRKFANADKDKII